MKILKMFSLAAIVLLLVAVSTGCNKWLQQKIDRAKGASPAEEFKAEEQAGEEAQLEYLDEWQAFRTEAEKQLAANEKSLGDLKAKSAAAGSKASAALSELQQKNDNLKQKLQGYRDEGKVNWDAFKRDFAQDIEGLGKALHAEEKK